MINFLGFVYMTAVAILSFYGFLGLLTLRLYIRHRHDTFPLPAVTTDDLPTVTIQLPIFNERYVVKRLIEAAVALDYPRDKLQIQVVDDSTDDTTDRAAELVTYYNKKGVNISLLHRDNREGYKAGALTNALTHATGKFVAIFDADFAPLPTFLQQTIPHFSNEPEMGMIQARWGHLNPEDSLLTGAQAIALDKHFAMEQTVRHRANLFPKFNGAGGIWRKACMEDAGGWQDDTVCEDLCLSTRAILRGWQFRFLNDVTAPAELPTSITAFKNQQARWAKGSTQCMIKFGRDIIADKNNSVLARFYALFSMSAYTTHLLVLIMLLLQVPLIAAGYRFSPYMLLFTIAGLGQPILFILGQQVLYPDWRRRLRYFPALLLVAIGLAPSNTRAILQAFFGRQHVFVRTPKMGDSILRKRGDAGIYKMRFDWIVLVELFLALYAAVGIGLIIRGGNVGSLFFLLTCMIGFGYVGWLSFREAQ